jgi:hypothetical protein
MDAGDAYNLFGLAVDRRNFSDLVPGDEAPFSE